MSILFYGLAVVLIPIVVGSGSAILEDYLTRRLGEVMSAVIITTLSVVILFALVLTS